jgi:hypothetical protein
VPGKPFHPSLLFVSPEPTRMEHLTGTTLSLPEHIRRGCKSLPETNALAHLTLACLAMKKAL